ncbi:MAG: M23 family metallopeptidase [Sphingobacteriaceae bacterium]|nr:MAG: M23 family metallopeptidase [Sphingobacteriaceae bacterium]
MKRYFLFLLFCLSLTEILHGQDLKIFHENKPQGYIVFASNAEWYPVSVDLSLELMNMSFSEGSKTLFVIPARTDKFKIGELSAQTNGAYRFNYKSRFTMGDVTLTDYDKSFAYDLPFGKGRSYQLFQGYHGSFSHQKENALDFTMPESTEVLAVRDGVVVQVVQNNTESCPSEECKKYNNYLTVMHSDGTFASYVHIKYNGARFQPGQHVKKGDVIAMSGNVGFTSGPHLHFVCFVGGFDGWKTLETKFKTGNGDTAIFLQEGSIYTRNY